MFNSELGFFTAVGLFFTGMLLIKMGELSLDQIPIFHLMVFNYFNELFLFAWFLYGVNTVDLPDAIEPQRYFEYFSFIIPACVALYAGGMLGVRNTNRVLRPRQVYVWTEWSRFAVPMFWIGMIVATGLVLLPAGSVAQGFSFVLVLIASLRYVALFTFILLRHSTWWIYGLLVFGLEISIALSIAFMHDLVLWGGLTALVIAYRYQLGHKLSAIIICTYFAIFGLQLVKVEYRNEIWNQDISLADKAQLFLEIAFRHLSSPDQTLDERSVADTLARFNQGWIVNRVMQHVPEHEPFALGSSLATGLYGIVVPRALDPNKPVAGGRENFERFTGLTLNPYTAMTVSVPGELYANFGTTLAILGIGVFGWLIGMAYRMLHLVALQNPVWWAWGPYCGFNAIKASEGLMEILSWIVRSIIVLLVVVWACHVMGRRNSRAPG